MVGKKGMSPIIATILLIAFAVALGAMIMNWSSSLISGGAKASACGDANIKMREDLCYNYGGNKVELDLVNTGDSTIENLILRLNSTDVQQDLEIKYSVLEPGDIMVKKVPIILPDEFTLQLIPTVMVGEEEATCDKVLKEVQELPSCAKNKSG